MKIFGIFRGFPGLGRVVAGAGILNTLKFRGHKIKAYSYLQGNIILEEYGLEKIISKQPDERHVMVIGLNPISNEGGVLIEEILRENPDLILMDGEPLLVSTLAMVFPREKILSLLNPADIENKSLPLSTMKFYRSHYLSAGCAFVHGILKENYSGIGEEYACQVHSIQTILRPEILNLANSKRGSFLIGILGGGSKMVSQNFFYSTVSIAKSIISLSEYLPTEKFIIYCNDAEIHDSLSGHLPDNLKIIGEYTPPEIIYNQAKAVLCRAGRNTVSELMFLKMPSILYSTSGDFRSAEQDKNIDNVCALSEGFMEKCRIDDPAENIARSLHSVINSSNVNFNFTAGNEEILKYIENLQR